MADVELLPLPEHLRGLPATRRARIGVYARANMEPLLRERDSLRNWLEDTVRELTDAKAENERLEEALRKVAAIAHCGGLANLSEESALLAVRKLTLPHFDTSTEERDVLAALEDHNG